jgi:hypothetical protein
MSGHLLIWLRRLEVRDEHNRPLSYVSFQAPGDLVPGPLKAAGAEGLLVDACGGVCRPWLGTACLTVQGAPLALRVGFADDPSGRPGR